MNVDLEARLKRLMVFRVVMVTTLLFIATYFEAVISETLPRINPLYFVIGAMYALTVVHAVALRFVPFRPALSYAQVVGDLVIITVLVHVTGGVRTGFLLLYPLSVLSATMLVPRRGALAIAGVATVLYGGLLALVRLRVLEPAGLRDVLETPDRALFYSAFVLGVACATVALLGSYLAESVQVAGRQLQKAEVQVADLRELNQLIVDSIQSGLIMTDADGGIRHVNAFGAGILGRPAHELLGLPVGHVLTTPVLGRAELQARAALRALARLEITYRHPDGEQLDLGVSVTPLATAQETDGGYLVVFQDLTDVRRLEAEVRTNEKLAAVGEMAAQLAHEIRNPLGSIRGSAQVLAGEPGFNEEQGRLLKIISRESKRLSDTLNRFLFQARSTGRPRDVVDLRPLLEEAVTLLRNGPEIGAEHEVRFETDEGPHLCLADPGQMTQVFWNLARNALEAMPGGGDLDIRLHRRGGEVLLVVRDQGRGIDREEQRRVFEPFRSTNPMGTGLGLAIVYRIVREHGGDISVRSAPREGTEVEVRLPVVAVAETASVGTGG